MSRTSSVVASRRVQVVVNVRSSSAEQRQRLARLDLQLGVRRSARCPPGSSRPRCRAGTAGADAGLRWCETRCRSPRAPGRGPWSRPATAGRPAHGSGAPASRRRRSARMSTSRRRRQLESELTGPVSTITLPGRVPPRRYVREAPSGGPAAGSGFRPERQGLAAARNESNRPRVGSISGRSRGPRPGIARRAAPGAGRPGPGPSRSGKSAAASAPTSRGASAPR